MSSPAKAPVGGPRALQLLYSNVDRVIDGRETSGWQTMARSPQLDDATAATMLSLIEPSLAPIAALPGFPTPEEVAGADRRMAQIPTSAGLAVVHTAPAGKDTTGRPNTMSHVLLLQAEPSAPRMRTIDLWRSPGWVAPFGPDRVRRAELPDPSAIVPGDTVDDDAVADFIASGSRAEVLAALADALEPVLSGAHDAASPGGPTVVLAVDSTDEAALWIGALLRTCAPAQGRRLGYSVLQRLSTATDVSMLRESPLHLACVPRQDLERLDAMASGLRIIDPAASAHGAQPDGGGDDGHHGGGGGGQASGDDGPRTTWGVLVLAMAQDLGTWVAAYEGMGEILSLMDDHEDLTPAWPLAMAEACEPGVLGPRLREEGEGSIEQALIACHPRALTSVDYLASVVAERLLGSSQRHPAHWYSLLAAVPEHSGGNRAVSGLATKYLEAVCTDRSWLTDLERPALEPATRVLEEWSRQPHGAAVIDRCLTQILAAPGGIIPPIAAAPPHGPGLEGRSGASSPDGHALALQLTALDRLMRDGLALPTAAVGPVLSQIGEALCRRGGDPGLRSQILGLPISRSTRQLVATEVEARLRECPDAPAGRRGAPPLLDPRVLDWLTQGAPVPDLPHLEAQAALALLIDGGGEAGRAVNALRSLASLGASAVLSPEALLALQGTATPAQAAQLPTDCRHRGDILAAALARDPDSDAARRAAADFLISRGHPESDFAARAYTAMSVGSAMSLVVLSAAVPLPTLLTTESGRARTYALNVLCAARILESSPLLARARPVRRALDRALALLVCSVWSGVPVNLTPPGAPPPPRAWERYLDEVLSGTAGRLEDPSEPDPGPAEWDGDRLGRLVPMVEALYAVSLGNRPPQRLEDWANRVRADLENDESLSSPVLRQRDEVALAALRSTASLLGRSWPGALDALEAGLSAGLPDDPSARRWLAKQLMVTGRPGGRGLRIFG
ncbi:hypothetical protein NSA19_08150 [Actinomyces bowdenii]|uniref:GAP1-N2 domain-containing protein n=1 Tax=Actinomyces bowdenii TaxID=131109 RepID=UPI00214BBD64|nr:hypothetical protein [Actinomyces bowdenii]MCR2052814.1 hypothetical protein [Actinomyces bowdenii]